METQQPKWKCVGHVGDVDPIAHGGGFVYVDETGVYGPELQWFEPGPDEVWQRKGGKTKLQYFRILLERGEGEWWWPHLVEVSRCTGVPMGIYQTDSCSDNAMARAKTYFDLINYYGPRQFDDCPGTMTEDEAYEAWAEEMKMSLSRGGASGKVSSEGAESGKDRGVDA